MASSDKIVPDWVWKRRWSRSWARNATVVYGLFIGGLGLAVLLLSYEIRSRLSDICPTYSGCAIPTSPGSPLADVMMWLSLGVTALAAALIVAGFVYAFNTWRVKEWEWAAMFGVQPFAKRLQNLYSQGKLTKQQVDEIISILTT